MTDLGISAVPRHVAIIMDGNGRWAQRRGRPRVFGHVRGCFGIPEIVSAADRLGIQALTLYAFSTENWSRPEGELQVLWKLLKKFLRREEKKLAANQVRLQVIGELERLGSDVREVLDPVTERLSKNTGLQLTFAVSYGSRREILQATQAFAEDCARGDRQPSELSEKLFEQYLWTRKLGELANVDLVIRTSGEKRVSNFLLWQAAYAEFVFEDLCWPDFKPVHLEAALREYAGRERRFGGVGRGDATTRPLGSLGRRG